MTTVENLKHGEVLLVSVRPVAGGKVQFEIAEHVVNPNLGLSLVSLLNASDERFQQGKPRRAWISAEPADAIKYFPAIEEKIKQAVKLGEEAKKNGKEPKSVEPILVNLLGPSIADTPIHLQVIEKTSSELEEEYAHSSTSESRKSRIEWISQNLETVCKRAGADGEFLFHHGENIISEVEVVAKKANHRFLEITARSQYLDGRDTGEKVQITSREKVDQLSEEDVVRKTGNI